MKNWLKIKLAEFKVAWHLGAIDGYQKLLDAGRDQDYCYKGVMKHFMKMLEAFTYLVSVGERTPTSELNEELKKLHSMAENL